MTPITNLFRTIENRHCGLGFDDRNVELYGTTSVSKSLTELYVKYPELSCRNTIDISRAFDSCDIVLVEEYALTTILKHDRASLYRYLEPLLSPTVKFSPYDINILVAGVAPWLFYVVEGVVSASGSNIRIAYGSRLLGECGEPVTAPQYGHALPVKN